MIGGQGGGRRQPLEPPAVQQAISIYQFRRRRARLFGDAGLFGEPAYDILLDLYIALHQGRKVTISDACVAADVPCSTALRTIRMLEQHGLVRRIDDLKDRRRRYLLLEDLALATLNRMLVPS